MSVPRIWLVTGASTGFGLEMTRRALAQGDKVVATLRKPEVLKDLAAQWPSEQLLVVKLDVTKPQEIKDAFQKAKAAFGRVDIVFNNAGYVVAGEAEATPDEPARAMFETNFWGAAHVSQEAVRFFRDENKPQGGHLIQNSAAVGIACFPNMGLYGAAKHALEGFTETLNKEISPAWNIKITSVLPGGFVTDIASGGQVVPQHPAYADPSSITSITRKWVAEATAKENAEKSGLGDARKGVQKIFELSKLPNPPLRLLLGKDSYKYVRETLARLTSEMDNYESWSDDLLYKAK